MTRNATTGQGIEGELARAGRQSRVGARGRTSSRYWVCLAVLVLGAGALQYLRAIGAQFVKAEVPLKRELKAFDRTKLLPEYRLDDVPATPLEADMLETLGTEQYVSLKIYDEENPNGAASVAQVFITYYTGKPDQVPHVPDECFIAGGFDRVGQPRNISVPVAGVGAPEDAVPVRVTQFRSQAGPLELGMGPQRSTQTLTVMYFFHCNGRYITTRDGVRWALGSLWDHYAYYAKFEVQFGDRSGRPAPLEASQEALGPLLQKLLPIILKDHFADWDALTKRSGAVDSEEG